MKCTLTKTVVPGIPLRMRSKGLTDLRQGKCLSLVSFSEISTHRNLNNKHILAHRLAPLKSAWQSIYPPLVTHLKLQVRMNTKARAIELRTSKHTTNLGALQKGEDFVRCFCLGFDCDDAIALLRLDGWQLPSLKFKATRLILADLYIETFEIKEYVRLL